jgi:hypothetical protein
MRKVSSIAALEPLESRRLLAGNIAVTQDAGANVHINGDNKSNAFDVEFDDVTCIITGLNGTTINGGPSVVLPFASGFLVDTGNGDDFVGFDQATDFVGTGGNIVIETGNGQDTASVSNWSFSASLGINTGSGNDTVLLNNAFMHGAATIDTGNGSDHVAFATVGGFGSLTIVGANGPDSTSGILTATVATLTLIDIETIG